MVRSTKKPRKKVGKVTETASSPVCAPSMRAQWRQTKLYLVPAIIAVALILAFQRLIIKKTAPKAENKFNGTLPKKLTVGMLRTDPDLVQAVIANTLSRGIGSIDRKVDIDGSALSGTIAVDILEL